MSEKESQWNSLEVAKLLVSISLPIAIVIFGFFTNEALQNSQKKITEALQDRQSEIRLSEAVIKKRQEIYDQIRLPLNNIYCYIREVGGYKSMTPETVIKDRRSIHKDMHTQRAYWSPETFSLYLKYMDRVAFITWQGVNKDALIQDNPGQKTTLPSWKNEWQSNFSGKEHPEHDSTYNQLLDSIARDIGANIGR
jgi:hypothetical protein